MTNSWKSVPDYESLYEINTLGEIRSVGRNKLMKHHIDKGGYPKVTLCKQGKHKTYLVHRLVALAFIPSIDISLEVNHIDGNKQNNSVSNLEWCTRQANQQHAFCTGLNKAPRNMLNRKHSEESKLKMSQSAMGRKAWNKGLSSSEETKKKISLARTGKTMSIELRARLSEIHKERYKTKKK